MARYTDRSCVRQADESMNAVGNWGIQFHHVSIRDWSRHVVRLHPSSLGPRQLLWKHLRQHYQYQDLGSQCTAVQLDNNSAKYDEQYDDEQQFTELIILSKFSQGIMSLMTGC